MPWSRKTSGDKKRRRFDTGKRRILFALLASLAARLRPSIFRRGAALIRPTFAPPSRSAARERARNAHSHASVCLPPTDGQSVSRESRSPANRSKAESRSARRAPRANGRSGRGTNRLALASQCVRRRSFARRRSVRAALRVSVRAQRMARSLTSLDRRSVLSRRSFGEIRSVAEFSSTIRSPIACSDSLLAKAIFM